MSTSLQSKTQFTGSFDAKTSPGEPRVGDSGSEIPNLQSQVSVLTNSISDEAVRLAVGKILTDLVFLLDYLSLVAGLKDFGGIKEVVSILNTVRGEAYSVAVFIEDHALHLEGIDHRLSETLDSSAYAINHEVRRIFNGELAGINVDRDDLETRWALVHAQGVLTNCFQQCMVDVARVFDASVTDARLFQDWQSRRESSLSLYHDLSELIALIKESEKDSLSNFPGQSRDHLEERLKSFREGSMRCLMYKDWQQYEALSEKIIASVKSGESPADLLHHMGCYLETLLAHIKTRSVLADLDLESLCIYEKIDIS
ncbi:MAG: hypothetical protein ND866_20835 [Pyrinomonadaceae bacterium]|nr:hypothetical protein [Pyrinomonadaceae bacterium]